jgi:uncharacterized membrane protein YgcG
VNSRTTFALLSAVSLLAALTACPLAAQEKSISWDAMAVHARLDAEGALHVAERQTFIFTGDWNGGYRQFRLGAGQRLHLERLLRIDAETGQEVPLIEGDLDEVDHYAWKKSRTLRWRSRRPSDPPFAHTRLTYEIDYTLTGILWASDGLYHLDNDFAFPDREGPIARFTLDLELAPVWRPAAPLRSHFEAANLQPGESYVVKSDFEYLGAGSPSGIRTLPSAGVRGAFFVAALLAMAWLYFRFREHERGLGRWSPPPLPETPDAEWLAANVFAYPPEEVGALWDRVVGPPEVAATLARLVGEGKLASEVVPPRTVLGLVRIGGDVLHLRRVAAPEAFTGHEKKLVNGLFFGGRTEVDTNEIRAHYKSTGFDPANLIRGDLEKRLSRHAELKGKTPPPSRRPTLYLILATVVILVLDGFPVHWVRMLVDSLIVPSLAVFFYVPGLIGAFAWRNRTERLDAGSLFFLIPGAALWGFCLGAVFLPDVAPGSVSVLLPGFFGCLGFAMIPVLAMNSLLNNARSRETAETIRRRQVLAAARRWFERELRRPAPALQDDWFPYLLAFGLNSDVNRWFHSYGSGSQAARSLGGSSFSSGGGSGGGSGSSGWTGGGGAFGGAGASGTWAAAATGLAAGVSAPSSSGGGGGGGGGGSSGGGGGGGW